MSVNGLATVCEPQIDAPIWLSPRRVHPPGECDLRGDARELK